MSNLRRKKRELVTEEDIEAPIAPRKYDAAASPSAASSRTATGSSHRPNNPALLARTVLRKVLDVLKSEDAGDITTFKGVFTLLQDIAAGVILGLLTVSALIFLDHKDVIHLQSAHKYRNAAFTMVQDPETRKNFEESLGLMFMEAGVYKKNVAKVKSFPADIIGSEERIRKVIADLEVAKKEYAAIKPGYDILVNDPMLGLDKFCDKCSWKGGRDDCFMRLTYLMETYNLKPMRATIDLMKSTPQCVKNV